MNQNFHCYDCDKITPHYRLTGETYWVYACSPCGGGWRTEIGEFDCPNCGYYDEDETNVIERTGFGISNWEYQIQTWNETCRCPICKTIYTFSNANG